MSEHFVVKMPKLGESIVSAKVVTWLKKEGDAVQSDEPLLEVSTDKVNSEIPSPVAGTLTRIFAEVGQEYDVGSPLCELSTQERGEAAPSGEPAREEPKKAEAASDFYSPAVLRLARQYHISLDELQRIQGSGAGGRITKQDVEAYAESKPSQEAPSSEVQRVEMSQTRKAIAENMSKSFYQAPHATLISEVDITPILKWIKENKESFFNKNGYKITITAFIAKAIATSLQSYPFINASVEGDSTILLKRYVNLGIAVSVEDTVMVPVMRGCQQKSVSQIAWEIAELSRKARAHELNAEEVSAGTITMTNFGMGGTKIGIPIIRHPEVAIVGIGAIQKAPKAIDDTTIVIRDTLHISLTFDHRALDGMYGCAFLEHLRSSLEGWDLSLGL